MSTERVFNIVMMELTSDNLKYEQELERVINSDLNTLIKINKIKKLLGKMVTIEASIAKFSNMVNNNNKNNNNQIEN